MDDPKELLFFAGFCSGNITGIVNVVGKDKVKDIDKHLEGYSKIKKNSIEDLREFALYNCKYSNSLNERFVHNDL